VALDTDALELAPLDGGTRLRLRVKAGGRANALLGAHGGALKLSVTAAPEKGKANRAVLALLGGALRLPPSALRILSGHGSPDKSVAVPLAPAQVAERLAAATVAP
jgi:uncharacterized protein YggU (UPF0235/DUF167 family)